MYADFIYIMLANSFTQYNREVELHVLEANLHKKMFSLVIEISYF